MFYMAVCFIQNREKIKNLLIEISQFDKYGFNDSLEVDRRAILYSKVFLVYSIAGMVVYSLTPPFLKDYCEQHKPRSMETYGVPCVTMVRYRLPIRFDRSPMHELCYMHQFFVGSLTTVIIVILTMLICGILMHIICQLRNLRRYIISSADQDDIRRAVHFAIEYHIAIIEYLDKVNDAFGTQVILHVTLTSFVISVLGFEILMVGNLFESLRFGLHLAGWLVLLYLICYYGQRLIDESFGVAMDGYAAAWYECPVDVQKDIYLIIARAQKPMTLKALYLGSVSLGTFLKVLSSAYSYFTLLVNIKK